jgi:glucose/arabinose dehydrogenase
MFVSVGSLSNDAEELNLTSPRQWLGFLRHRIGNVLHGGSSANESEHDRADVLAFSPKGENRHIYASGIRNCVGMAVNSSTGDLWCATNERDGLRDDLPSDYITRVREGGFYGWPWYYIGAHEDPRHKGARPDLKNKVIVPDILLQAHSAPLQMMVYSGEQFPNRVQGQRFCSSARFMESFKVNRL